MNLLQNTLLALQTERLNVNLESLLDECLQYLIDTKIVILKEQEQNDETIFTYETTKLGKATVEGLKEIFFFSNQSISILGSVDLGLASPLYDHLLTSLVHMNLENPLHLLFIVMPFDLPSMTISFRQLVDRVDLSNDFLWKRNCLSLNFLDSRNEIGRKKCSQIITNR